MLGFIHKLLNCPAEQQKPRLRGLTCPPKIGPGIVLDLD